MTTARYADALAFAADLHRDQVRKGSGLPYVTHLLSASVLVWEDGGDEDQAIAALLHDAVEDQGGEATLAEVRRRFGDDVAELVAACTDSWEDPKPPWGPRKRAYVEHLHEVPERALVVIAADKLHNATSIVEDHARVGAAVWDRFTASAGEVRWYYEAVHAALAARRPTSRSVVRLGGVVRTLADLTGPVVEPAER